VRGGCLRVGLGARGKRGNKGRVGGEGARGVGNGDRCERGLGRKGEGWWGVCWGGCWRGGRGKALREHEVEVEEDG